MTLAILWEEIVSQVGIITQTHYRGAWYNDAARCKRQAAYSPPIKEDFLWISDQHSG